MSDGVGRPQLEEGRLANGVRFLLWPDARDTVASLQVWVRVGSAHERTGKTGLAHMLEHMMFRGTPTVPDGAFDEHAESEGLSINAATWLDYTFYTSTGPSAGLERMVGLEADRFANLSITDKAFYPERDVVANERRQVVESSPDALLGERLQSLAYKDSPYEWPTIGWAEDIASYEADDLRAFYRSGYVASNLLVVATGSFDVDRVSHEIATRFGALEAGTRAEETTFVRPGSANETMNVAVSSPRLLLSWPAPPRRDRTYAAWAVLDELLAAAESSVLPTRLEHVDRSAIDVQSALNVLRGPSTLDLDVTLRRDADVEDVTGAIYEELAILAESVDERALLGARNRIRTSCAIGLADTAGRAESVGEGWATCDDPQHVLRLVADVADVSVDDVRAVAGTVLDGPSWRLVGVPS